MSAIQNTLINGLLIFSLLFLSSSQASTASSMKAPDDLLKDATIEMLHSINEHRAEIKQSPEKLISLVEQIILPHLDFIAASKIVMGKYWRLADQKQKVAFIQQFRLLLLRFYSSALAEYLTGNDKTLPDDLIHYFPIKLNEGETSLTVRAELIPESGQAIPIHYRVHLTSKGWKIYDVAIEGVSMITTYKTNFATQFKTQGIDALIASIEEKNKQLLVNNNKNSL